MQRLMVWKNKLITLLFIILLVGCSTNNYYETFDKLFVEAGKYQSYHNESYSNLVIDKYNIDVTTDTIMDYDNQIARISSKQVFNDKAVNSNMYIQDNKIYYDLDGVKSYDSFTDEFSNMNDIYFTKDEVKSSTLLNDEVRFNMSDDFCTKILMFNGVDTVEKVNKYDNEMIITYDNERLTSQSFNLSFDIEAYDGDNIVGNYVFTSVYSQINSTNVEPLVDTSAYEQFGGLNTIDKLKESLVNELGYMMDSQGNYISEFNNNEIYKFDFNNHIFTYVYANTSYSYDWINDIGVYQGCTLKFADDSQLGDCNDNKIKDLQELKLNFYTELTLCGFDDMPLE